MEIIPNFSNFELQPLVVGGENAAPNSIPYQVNLQFSGEFGCGGSILNSLFILTAAHCLFNEDHSQRSTSSILVVAGDYNIYKSEDTEQYRSVYDFYVHPGYNSSSNLQENDIAILRLGRPLNFNSAVQPISFPKRDTNFTGFGKLSGWGRLGFLNKTHPPELQEVMLPLVPEAECQNLILKFNLFREQLLLPLTKNNICAGMFGKSVCFGDSGGPLVCKVEGGSDILCGIVSTTVNCSYDNPLPSFFTDVSKYGDWIDQIIKSRSNNPKYHPIVGEGFNEVESNYLPNSPFDLGEIFANNESFYYPIYNKTDHSRFSVGYISIISQTFPSYMDYEKRYLAKMYPDLSFVVEQTKNLNNSFAWLPNGSYIEDNGTFSFLVIEYLGYHKLDKSVAINSWDQSYLDKLRDLNLLNPNSSCDENMRWKQFFQKFGTHYIRRLTIGKFIEKQISVSGKEEIEKLRKKWGILDCAPLRPMINESFPFVTEQELKQQELDFVPTLTPNVVPIYKILEESADLSENMEKKVEFKKLATKFKTALIMYRTNKFWECEK